jgi:DNA-binding MarR family transcriptional regulator
MSAVSDWSALLALQRATHATLQVLASELIDLGLTGSEANALANLADGQPRTVSSLGAAMGIRPTTLTSVLDRLDKRGYVTRTVPPENRRSVVVGLTGPGRIAAADIRQVMAAIEARALAGLPAGAIAGLRAGLEALTEVTHGRWAPS